MAIEAKVTRHACDHGLLLLVSAPSHLADKSAVAEFKSLVEKAIAEQPPSWVLILLHRVRGDYHSSLVNVLDQLSAFAKERGAKLRAYSASGYLDTEIRHAKPDLVSDFAV